MAAVENLKNVLRESNIPTETVAEILKGFEDVTDRSKKQKRADFFIEVVARMEKMLDIAECRRLRELCACSQNIYRTGALRKLSKDLADKTLEQKLEVLKENKKFGSSTLSNGNTIITFCSESCRCGCPVFEGVEIKKKIPDSYCYCCAGYFRSLYQTVLGLNLQTVEIRSSALVSRGKHPCRIVFRITDSE